MVDLVELDDFEELDGATKEKGGANLNLFSPQDPPFPLTSLLAIYLRSNKQDTYVDWMRGFKLLVAWLGPFKELDAHIVDVDPIFATYEIQQLAKIIGCRYRTVFWEILLLTQRKE